MTSELGWLAVNPGGRVQCPRRNEELELERCLECNWLLDLDRAAGTPALRCSAVSPVPNVRDPLQTNAHVD